MLPEHQTNFAVNSSVPTVSRAAAFMVALTLANCVGCQSESEVTAYVIPAESEQIYLTELLQDEYPLIPFEWQVPEEWKSARLDQISLVAWNAGSHSDSGRVTASTVNIGIGVAPQLTRWRGQIGVREPNGGALEGAEFIKIGDQEATYIDLKGKTETILGMILPVRGDLWVFKYRGSNQRAASEKKLFRTFCESVRPTAAGPLEVGR